MAAETESSPLQLIPYEEQRKRMPPDRLGFALQAKLVQKRRQRSRAGSMDFPSTVRLTLHLVGRRFEQFALLCQCFAYRPTKVASHDAAAPYEVEWAHHDTHHRARQRALEVDAPAIGSIWRPFPTNTSPSLALSLHRPVFFFRHFSHDNTASAPAFRLFVRGFPSWHYRSYHKSDPCLRRHPCSCPMPVEST